MISSDEESLAGLTQVPSQKHDYEGNVKKAGGNETTSYSDVSSDDSVYDFLAKDDRIIKKRCDVNDINVVLQHLFPTPPEENIAIVSAEKAELVTVEPTGVCILMLLCFILCYKHFLPFKQQILAAIALFSLCTRKRATSHMTDFQLADWLRSRKYCYGVYNSDNARA